EYPSVGDWVLIGTDDGGGDAVIQMVLPRRSCFSRKAILAGGPTHGDGRTEEQVLAANIDIAFLVSGLDGDWNPRRIERFLSVTYDSGASPVILLNKADVCDDVAARISEVSELAMGVPVHALSAVERSGLEGVRGHVTKGRTAVFLGSSGVGKSTIINGLLGEDRLDTGGVRLDDSRGRHTTTRRELLLLPGGGMVVDTPGLRRIQLWGDEAGLERTFADIEHLVRECRFSDCHHVSEPGCAVRAAIARGELSEDRFESFVKLQKELRNLAVRKDARVQKQSQRAWDKRCSRIMRERERLRKKGWI
ncbi:MAG: ribosome small subunit-dependent GTPase A, partial [candidate division Zixibacteria bacterium]|nr:ribosome small subunit-dependent GTPase A [candidate division Zixibacteria bacterium]